MSLAFFPINCTKREILKLWSFSVSLLAIIKRIVWCIAIYIAIVCIFVSVIFVVSEIILLAFLYVDPSAIRFYAVADVYQSLSFGSYFHVPKKIFFPICIHNIMCTEIVTYTILMERVLFVNAMQMFSVSVQTAFGWLSCTVVCVSTKLCPLGFFWMLGFQLNSLHRRIRRNSASSSEWSLKWLWSSLIISLHKFDYYYYYYYCNYIITTSYWTMVQILIKYIFFFIMKFLYYEPLWTHRCDSWWMFYIECQIHLDVETDWISAHHMVSLQEIIRN